MKRIFQLYLLVLVVAVSASVVPSQELSVEQQNAIDLLKTLARDLKKEPDKFGAAKLQARIADELWSFDEPFARESFRWSFEAAAQPLRESAGATECCRAVCVV